jgi:hypothetical protein
MGNYVARRCDSLILRLGNALKKISPSLDYERARIQIHHREKASYQPRLRH